MIDSESRVPSSDREVRSDDLSAQQTSEYETTDYAQLSRKSRFERDEEWLDERARIKRLSVRVAIWGGGSLLALLVVIVFATAVAHLFIPQIGWLTDAQQLRLVAWYSSVAQVLFPVLIVTNPWLLRLLPRREQHKD